MKLMWFHLKPYAELPDDFRDNHSSVAACIHSSRPHLQRAHHAHSNFLDGCRPRPMEPVQRATVPPFAQYLRAAE